MDMRWNYSQWLPRSLSVRAHPLPPPNHLGKIINVKIIVNIVEGTYDRHTIGALKSLINSLSPTHKILVMILMKQRKWWMMTMMMMMVMMMIALLHVERWNWCGWRGHVESRWNLTSPYIPVHLWHIIIIGIVCIIVLIWRITGDSQLTFLALI